jgi:hypothetical protein
MIDADDLEDLVERGRAPASQTVLRESLIYHGAP